MQEKNDQTWRLLATGQMAGLQPRDHFGSWVAKPTVSKPFNLISCEAAAILSSLTYIKCT